MSTDLPHRRTTSVAVRHPDSRQLLELGRFTAAPRASLIIDIDERGDRYLATLSDGGAGPRDRCICQLSPTDLSEVYRSVSDSAVQVLKGNTGRLYELANTGYFVFCQIFTRESMRDKIRRVIRDADAATPVYVVVHSERFSIPWNLLYLSNPEEDVTDPTQFMGYRCAIVSDIRNPEEVTPQPVPEMHPQIEVLSAYCDRLRYSRDFEIPFIRRHVNWRRVANATAYREFPILTSQGGRPCASADRMARKALFAGRPAIVHFACHGSNSTSADRNYLRVRDGYPLTQASLKSESERFQSHPVVFLNACNVGFVDPLKFTGLVRFFLDQGARAVVAPDCKIGDLSAAHFAQLFYKFFSIGQRPLMDSMFWARRQLYSRYRDMAGFTYALYGQPHARLTVGDGS